MPNAPDERGSALERTLILTEWFASRRGSETTLHDITKSFPEYAASDSEASRRMLRRDLQIIEDELRIEIEWDNSKSIYTVKPPVFTRDERASLLRAMGTVRVDGIAEDADETEIGHARDQSAAQIAVRLPLIVSELNAPIRDRQMVEFWYKKGERRRVEPHRIGRGGVAWYLLARDKKDGAIKHFRLDRILEVPGAPAIVAVGELQAFEIPDHRDLAGEFDVDPNEWGRDAPLEAEVAMSRDLATIFCNTVVGARISSEQGENAIVSVTVRHYVAFLNRVLSFGSHVRLENPPELVEMLISSLKQMSGAK